MFETGLVTFLSTGTSAGERVYPRRLMQGVALPALVWTKVSGGISYNSSGESSLKTPRFQINCWGGTALQAKTLAEEIKAKLSGYRGAMGSKTVTAVFIEDEQDDQDENTERWLVRLDVIIHHN